MPLLRNDFIDPQLALSRRDRKRVIKGAWKRWLRTPANLVLYFCLCLIVPLAVMMIPELLESRFQYRHWSSVFVTWAIIMAVYALIFNILQRFRFAPCVYAELRARGHDVCPRCGYALTGLEDATACPECGATRPRPPRG